MDFAIKTGNRVEITKLETVKRAKQKGALKSW